MNEYLAVFNYNSFYILSKILIYFKTYDACTLHRHHKQTTDRLKYRLCVDFRLKMLYNLRYFVKMKTITNLNKSIKNIISVKVDVESKIYDEALHLVGENKKTKKLFSLTLNHWNYFREIFNLYSLIFFYYFHGTKDSIRNEITNRRLEIEYLIFIRALSRLLVCNFK